MKNSYLVLPVVALAGILFTLGLSKIVRVDTQKQVEDTQVQNSQYYGVFQNGVSSFETLDSKCFVIIVDSYGTGISCYKK